MKKKSLLWVLFNFCLILVTACGATKLIDNTQKAYFQLINNNTDVRITYVYKNDKVLKQTTRSTVKYKAVGIKSAQDAQKNFASSIEDPYKGIKGIKHKVDYKSTYLIENIIVDYKKANIDKLVDAAILQIDQSSNEKIDYISYK
ncbi:hypothetical protein HMPREF9318_01244 [Streptococcus urinalis FB127-CNA-2]|uniref:Lipoprotein n=1 Tax=Streptococcus urinalis 2285-97 TaxID=764291 RepID=G5KC92_9STRE|nr:DUF1307 domain-containing protein [Streptococcus urinalis]EHJ57590.1 putative lipoprotein [Streptococcus urinalis 2285-97]EKS19722.1 hypothetical protein HMPREF9318_01244 [Streptococcus urinalis FB127-CNA-2]VEF31299.1 lipoprotein [Streptococcus urinalis]